MWCRIQAAVKLKRTAHQSLKELWYFWEWCWAPSANQPLCNLKWIDQKIPFPLKGRVCFRSLGTERHPTHCIFRKTPSPGGQRSWGTGSWGGSAIPVLQGFQTRWGKAPSSRLWPQAWGPPPFQPGSLRSYGITACGPFQDRIFKTTSVAICAAPSCPSAPPAPPRPAPLTHEDVVQGKRNRTFFPAKTR